MALRLAPSGCRAVSLGRGSISAAGPAGRADRPADEGVAADLQRQEVRHRVPGDVDHRPEGPVEGGRGLDAGDERAEPAGRQRRQGRSGCDQGSPLDVLAQRGHERRGDHERRGELPGRRGDVGRHRGEPDVLAVRRVGGAEAGDERVERVGRRAVEQDPQRVERGGRHLSRRGEHGPLVLAQLLVGGGTGVDHVDEVGQHLCLEELDDRTGVGQRPGRGRHARCQVGRPPDERCTAAVAVQGSGHGVGRGADHPLGAGQVRRPRRAAVPGQPHDLQWGPGGGVDDPGGAAVDPRDGGPGRHGENPDLGAGDPERGRTGGHGDQALERRGIGHPGQGAGQSAGAGRHRHEQVHVRRVQEQGGAQAGGDGGEGHRRRRGGLRLGPDRERGARVPQAGVEDPAQLDAAQPAELALGGHLVDRREAPGTPRDDLPVDEAADRHEPVRIHLPGRHVRPLPRVLR